MNALSSSQNARASPQNSGPSADTMPSTVRNASNHRRDVDLVGQLKVHVSKKSRLTDVKGPHQGPPPRKYYHGVSIVHI